MCKFGGNRITHGKNFFFAILFFLFLFYFIHLFIYICPINSQLFKFVLLFFSYLGNKNFICFFFFFSTIVNFYFIFSSLLNCRQN